MKLHLKRNILLFTLAVIVLLLSFNYIVFLRVNGSFFKKPDAKSVTFADSYKPIQVKGENITFDLYNIPHPSSEVALLYIPSNLGILNNVLNSSIVKYNLFAINYPKERKFQKFETLVEMANLSINQILKTGIKPENIIIFGQGIGGNVALKVSEQKMFKSILVLNVFQGEKEYCSSRFSAILCLFVKNTIFIGSYTPNLIYYFFNDNSFIQGEENYEMFNKINSREKFFFEISGSDANFNFNQIIEFYNNENLTQNQNFEINQVFDIQDNADIIDNDGLFGDAENYID